MSRPPRILVVDPAPGHLLRAEIDAYLDIGLVPVINLRRVRQPQSAIEAYGDHLEYVDFDGLSTDALLAQVIADGEGFDVVKLRAGTPITEPFLRAACHPRLRRRLTILARAASGIDNVDLDAASSLGVTVTHTPGANAQAVAEFTIGLVLSAVRRIAKHDQALRTGTWLDPTLPVPSGSLAGASLGIVGPGLIGGRVARLARAFGMSVTACGSPRFTPADAARLRVAFAPSLAQLLRNTDIVTLHAPLTPDTQAMINAETLGFMRAGSVLVNTSRGPLVDEAALDRALSDPASPIAFAALDVFEHEGGKFDSVLARNPHCVLTPHIAGMTVQAMTEASQRLTESIRLLIAGRGGEMVAGHATAVRVLAPTDDIAVADQPSRPRRADD